MKPGEFYKVKRTPITRHCGVRTWGGAKGDDCAWPGEVGEVVKREWTAWDGSAMSGLWLEFSRGRALSLNTLSDDDRAEFMRVPTPEKRAVQWKTRAAFRTSLGSGWTWITWTHLHGSKHAAIIEKAQEIGAVAWDFGQADHGMSDRVNF